MKEFLEGEGTRTNGTVTTKTRKTIRLVSSGDAYYTDYYNSNKQRHGWMPVSPTSTLKPEWYPNRTVPTRISRSWLPVKDMTVKIDDGGNELTKVGNIGIRGSLNFAIEIVTEVETTTYIEDQVVGAQIPNPTYGKGNATSAPDGVKQVIGSGFDISGEYNGTSIKPQVFDFDKLIQYKRIEKRNDVDTHSEKISGSSIEEYSSKYNSSLGVSAKASLFGVTVSNETKKTFSEETYSKSGYEYITARHIISDSFWRIYGHSKPSDLLGFLDTAFLNDLNKETSDNIIKKYGTHVVLGALMGKRLDYSMCVQKSLTTMSKSSTFSTTTSIEYKPGLGGEKAKAKEGETQTLNLDLVKLLSQAKNPKGVAEAYNLLNGGKGGSQASDKTKEAASSTGGGSATISWSESSESKSSLERSTVQCKCRGVGGNSSLFSLIEEDYDANFSKWADSLSSYDSRFIGFEEGCLVPLYEIIPAGFKNTAESIKAATNRFLASKKAIPVALKKTTISLNVNEIGTKGSKPEKLAGDWEMCSQSGKKMGFKIQLEPINLSANKTIGVCISVTVYENGIGSPNTILQLNRIKEISRNSGYVYLGTDCDNELVDETIEGQVIGKYHDWVDVTDQIRGKSKFIDAYSSRVYLHFDGSGDDWDHVGIKCTLNIPAMYYKANDID